MVKNRMFLIKSIYILTDTLIIILAYITVYYLRFHTPLFFEQVGRFYSLKTYAELLVYLVPIYLLSYFFFQLYILEPLEHGWRQILRIAMANMVGLIMFIAFLYIWREYSISRIFLIFFFGLNVLLTIGSRLLLARSLNSKIDK